jgi:thymidylate synthase
MIGWEKHPRMFQVLEAETADALWLKAAHWFTPGGVAIKQGSRGGLTTEVLRVAITIQDPRQRWITSRAPAMNPAFTLAEVICIVCGRNDSALLNYFNPTLPRYAGKGTTYHGSYGYRLRKHFGIDQLERAYKVLSADRNSRQVVLQIWDTAEDLPCDNGTVRAEDIPCNIAALLKLRGGGLEWTQIMRSNDLVLGLPHNIVQFSSLQEVLAGWLGAEVGSYHHFADSLHLYERDAPVSDRIAPRPLPPNVESVALPKVTSERSFSDLAALGDRLSSPAADADDVLVAFQNVDLDPAFRSWAAILTADALRRRKAFRLVESVMQNCSNACLATMFERWMQRHGDIM